MCQRERRGAADAARNASPFLVSVDHRFIGDELDDVAQGVYDALGALDAAAPHAIATIGCEDLYALVDASERWIETGDVPFGSREAVIDASRRLRHLLERR
jgi:hypothetical protein